MIEKAPLEATPPSVPLAKTSAPVAVGSRLYNAIALLAVVGISLHLILRFGTSVGEAYVLAPLWIVLLAGGGPLVWELVGKLLAREFGSDLLAGISIVTSVLLGEYLAGAFVVLMLSGGSALEAYAVRRASSVLEALAKRMPSIAHLQRGEGVTDVDLASVAVGDVVVVFPHETCPIDGTVVSGHGDMDEAYLTGEPYRVSKTPGADVISGAINGETALTVKAVRPASDSRYAKIMQVMRATEERRPRMRRLGDQLGAWYTPLAVGIAVLAWVVSGEAHRFLAVLVVATPCPLLIAIPVAILGAISLAAQRGIIIKNPAALEQLSTCRTIIFDKTGTLTYGAPELTEQLAAPGVDAKNLLLLAASLERYSKHPLSQAVVQAATAAGLTLERASEMTERPGEGLRGTVAGRALQVTSRKKLLAKQPELAAQLPPPAAGLECVLLLDGAFAGVYRFRDKPRKDGKLFIGHLSPKHHLQRAMLVSGDRESEVRYLAEHVGIEEVYFSQSPEQKVEIVRRETALAPTIFLGDGINDAPALTAATVGLASGQNSDVTSEAADAVIMDSSLKKVDELLHIGRRLREIALTSAVGGMILSAVGMILAALGYLPPVAGAITQEVIDVIAVLNALRMAFPPKSLSDYQ